MPIPRSVTDHTDKDEDIVIAAMPMDYELGKLSKHHEIKKPRGVKHLIHIDFLMISTGNQ